MLQLAQLAHLHVQLSALGRNGTKRVLVLDRLGVFFMRAIDRLFQQRALIKTILVAIGRNVCQVDSTLAVFLEIVPIEAELLVECLVRNVVLGNELGTVRNDRLDIVQGGKSSSYDGSLLVKAYLLRLVEFNRRIFSRGNLV